MRRYIDLVYSAALRRVGDAQLAEDVAQGTFAALAHNARDLARHPVLSGWLHRTTRNLAVNLIRTNLRRQTREQEAVTMNQLLSAAPDAVNWQDIAPHLDAALDELESPDRDAVLLRYFEQKSARETAAQLGISEAAAQKRVSRAVERLRELLAQRGVTVGASGLAVVISAHAVQAAPMGLALTITTAAATLTGTTLATTATVTKALAMTTLQKTIVTVTIAVLAGAGLYEVHQVSKLREQNQLFQQQQAVLVEQIAQLNQALTKATNQVAALRDENERLSGNSTELLRLRGDVARLRSEVNNPDTAPMKAWLARVNLLKQRLEQNPQAVIPELQFVTQEDWLNAAQSELETDTDYRRALSILRSAGERYVASALRKALASFARDHNKQMPDTLSQLQPYLDSPLNVADLQRWEFIPASQIKVSGMGGDTVLTQKAPIDDVFDLRYYIGPNGYGSTEFLYQGIAAIMDPIYEAFRAAHNGEWPEDVSLLQPYVTTPEQQLAFQKLILKNSKGN